MRFFQTQLSQFEGLDTQILGSSTDAAAPQKAFADHCHLTFPLVSDHPKFEGAKAFGVFNEERMSNTRVAFVIDKAGIIRAAIGPIQDMEQYGREALETVKRLQEDRA